MANPPSPSLSDIRDYLIAINQLTSSDTSKDGLISRLLNGAIEFTQRRLRREYSTGIDTRYFDGFDKGYLLIDDFQKGSITRVASMNPDWSVAYVYATGNVITRGDSPVEAFHNRIEIINTTSENPYRVLGRSPYIFPRGIQNVEITANWGTWATLPNGLQNLIIDMVVGKMAVPQGRIRSMSVGGESLSFSEDDLSPQQRRDLAEYAKPLVEIA